MRILIVDDEIDLLFIGKTYLEKKYVDFEIVTVETAKEAFEVLESESIDVIISDYQMPEVSVILTTKQWLKNINHQHIFITGDIFLSQDL